jgi:hypothetical protein
MTREYVRDNSKPFVASQSTIRCLTDCERRAQLRYVLRVADDTDYVSPVYFRFGSALHKLCELTRHDFQKLTPELMEGVCMEFRLDWEKDGAKLESMYRSYAKARDYSETIHGLEVEVVTEDWLMYADMIAGTPSGWKIVDLKSASELDPLVLSKMKHDNQVNLYTNHAHLFAEKFNLDMKDFLGFEYREIEKPKERLKKNETRVELIARMAPKTRYTLARPQDLHVSTVFQMSTQLSRMRELFAGAEPTENRAQCVSKGSVCPFWSKCNGGKNYTQAKLEAENAVAQNS